MPCLASILAMTRTNVSMCVFVPSVLQGESSFCIGPTLSLNLDTLDFWQDTKGFHVITHHYVILVFQFRNSADSF